MADLSWKGTAKKWTLNEAKSLSPMRIAIMNTQERAELANFLRNQFNTRLSTFTRAGEIGYAVAKLAEDFEKMSDKLGMSVDPFEPVIVSRGKSKTLSPAFADRKNPQNALFSYIVTMQDFFNAKSSTLKGWREIKQEQDFRLFGYTEKVPSKKVKGRQYYKNVKRLDYTMSDAERITFWRTYKMLKRTGWTEINSYDSDIQRKFGSAWRTGKFDKTDIEAAFSEMLKVFDTRPDYIRESQPGVSSDPTAQDDGLEKEDGIDRDFYDQ